MAKRPRMPIDGNGIAIQMLYPSVTVPITIGAATNRNGSPIVGEVVRLVATSDCHIKFGGATVVATANDMFIPKGVPESFSLKGNQYIAVIQDSAGGNLFITVLE